MKTFFLLLALTAFTAVLAQNPKVSDDFTADVDFFEQTGEHTVHFEGTLYEDYTKGEQRIDTTRDDNQTKVEFLRLYNTHTEYEIENNKCTKRSFNRTMIPAFDWLKNAKKLDRECYSHFRNGTRGNFWAYEDQHIQVGACLDQTNQNEPFYLEEHSKAPREARFIYFKTFISGEPAASIFAVPSSCN